MTATTTTRSGAAPAAFPVSAPAAYPAAPSLEILPAGYVSPRTRRRRARLAMAIGAVVAGGTLFGLAGVHVLLAEGQFRLQTVQHQAEDARAQYVRLRLEVAQLESPQRVVAAAQERLGMVPPSSLTYLTPTGAVAAPVTPAATPPTSAPAPRSVDTTHGWAAAKPALSSRP